MKYLLIALMLMAGTGWSGELNSFGIPDNSVTFTGTMHLDNCTAHGLEHSWKYYRIQRTGLSECRNNVDAWVCKDHYRETEINYPSGVSLELPHGDLDEKVFRRVCKNCKISEDMRVVHKEMWEETEWPFQSGT